MTIELHPVLAMVDRQYAEFLRQIRFSLIQPETARGPDRRFVLEQDGEREATLLELPGTPIDAVNAALGPQTAPLYRTLRPLYDMPRMSSHAVGAIINHGVRLMVRGSAFVNVGVWHGFSLLSGMAGNRDRACIGVDNFSESGGPREAFMDRFERHRSPEHRFFYMGYEDYFANHHRGPIGVYLYDGNHDYEHQLRGLQVAEPFFDQGCVVLVDDTNLPEPREGTLDFIAQSARDYALLLDSRTAENRHPTYWNGLMVFQATGAADKQPAAPRDLPSAPANQADPRQVEPDSLVSLVVWDPEPDAAALATTIESALGQTWPNIEVLVMNQPGVEGVAEVIGSFGDRIVSIPCSGPDECSPSLAVARSRGDFVAVVDSHSDLDQGAVQMALALPGLVRFDRGAGPPRRTLRAATEVDDAVPDGEPYLLIDGDVYVAQTIGAGPARTLDARGEDKNLLDDDAAIASIERLRGEGIRFIVLLWTAFGWLSDRPRLARHLRSGGRCMVDNERVLIFELGETKSGREALG